MQIRVMTSVVAIFCWKVEVEEVVVVVVVSTFKDTLCHYVVTRYYNRILLFQQPK